MSPEDISENDGESHNYKNFENSSESHLKIVSP